MNKEGHTPRGEQAIVCVVGVVIYNRACADSPTCRSLQEACAHAALRVYVLDNSTRPNENADFCAQRGWQYVSMGGNKGLSRAYNALLDRVQPLSPDTLIVWMDDDTTLPPRYFAALEAQACAHPDAQIFTPIVYGSDGVIYSPNERRFFQNRFLTDETQTPRQSVFNAINSGLAVRSTFYQDYRYDERLFLDSVDHQFCRDACARGARFVKLDVQLQQNFFQRSALALDAERVWARYRIRIHDFMLYANTNCFYRWLGVVKVWLWALQMGLKTHSVSLAWKMMRAGVVAAWRLSTGRELDEVIPAHAGNDGH